MMKYSTLACLLFLSGIIFSQTQDNLSSFNVLVDSAADHINHQIPAGEKIFVNSKMPDEYFSLKSRFLSRLKNSGREIVTEGKSTSFGVEINLDHSLVKYSDTFKKKLFGEFKVKRVISIKGSYSIIKDSNYLLTNEINYSKSDTVNYDDIKSLENNVLPYTKGEIPSEPVFSSLLEPVIAISAAALTVILFFTVRSK